MKSFILALWLASAGIALQAAPQGRPDCWGSDKPCADGKYRDWQGHEQPATCNNDFENAHKCACAIATTDGDHCPPEGMNPANHDMGPECSTFCRTEACKCINQCDFEGGDGK